MPPADIMADADVLFITEEFVTIRHLRKKKQWVCESWGEFRLHRFDVQ